MKVKAILVFVFFSYLSFSQSPQKFTYQSIIKNSSGYLLKNQDVGLRISVLSNSSNGIEVYSEEHFPTSNSNGLVTLIIGEGLTNDNFSEIQWGDGEYFLKVEVDPEGGNSYIMNQTSQLLSVPYALYAGNSGSKLNLLGQDFITLQDQTLTINKVDLTDDVNGVLTIANGGTGSSTAPMVGVITAVDSPAARAVLGLGTAATSDSSAFATAAQGALADSAQQPPSEGAFVDGDKSKLDGIAASANNYSLPDATASTLGGIKVGTNLAIDSDGVLSSTDTNTTYSVGDGGLTENDFTDALKSKLDGIAASANNYSLPDATASTLGGIKVGTNLAIDSDGVLSSTDTNTTYSVGDGGLTENDFTDALKSKLDGITASANNYSLPDATASTLGGIKVGTNLAIDSDGVLSSTDTNTTYSVGDGGLTENDFTDALKSKLDGIAASANNYSLPDATASTLGGIKVGTNLAIDSDGVLSSTDTNTTYSVGDGGLTENDFTDALKSKLDGIAASANNYSLPDATASTLGGIKVGTNLAIDSDGVLSSTDTNTTYSVGDGGLTENDFTDALKSKLDGIAASANNYSLPDATASTLGGIKVGTNLAIDSDGVLSSTDTNTTYSVGDGGLTENDFTDALKSKLDGITASANNYSLPDATASTLGGIKVGTNLAIDSDGVLSSTDTNTTYSVGDGGLTENDFTDALKSKVDNLGTISTQDFDAVNIDGGTIDGTSTTQSLGDNSAKIATTAYVDNSLSTRDNLSEILANGNTTGGSDIIISSGDDISFSDTSKAFFGSDNDLQLYHNGSHNYFTNSTGNFEITSTGSLILQDANSAKWMMTNQNGSVLLYHNGTSKLSTTSSGISVTGNINSSGSTNPTITVSDNTNSHYLTLQGLDNASKIDYLSTLIFEYGSNNTEIARLTSTGLEITGGVTANKLSANNKTITPAGTVGNQTINSTAGSVNFGSSDTTLTVTNNLADDNSVIMLTRGTAISANRNMSVVPSSGQFIITLDASFGIETKIFFLIIN